jgi:hypothetical protein
MIVEERTSRPEAFARPTPDAQQARARRAPLAVVLTLLPIAGLTEVTLMRTFYRVGIYIPKDGPFLGVYRALTALGSFAMNLAMALTALALVLLAEQAWRRGLRTQAIALGAFVASSLVLRVSGAEALGPAAWLVFVLAAVAVARPFLRRPAPILHRLTVGGVLASVLLSAWVGFWGAAGSLAPSTAGGGGIVGAQLVAEVLVVATAILAFASCASTEGIRVRALIAGALAAALPLVAWHANGAVTGILVLWTAGLRLYLPIVVYALALGALAAAAVGWLPRHAWRSAGLALLLVAGMLLDSTYVQGLALVALVLLTDGVAVGGLPGHERDAAVPSGRR